jgi:hypothetical protein
MRLGGKNSTDRQSGIRPRSVVTFRLRETYINLMYPAAKSGWGALDG